MNISAKGEERQFHEFECLQTEWYANYRNTTYDTRGKICQSQFPSEKD
jgi:hypothetical protein